MYYILIVEGDGTITNVLKRTLEEWNYQVAAITDFNRVLEQFGRTAPDLVLSDTSLPFLDDYYWCDQICRLSQVLIILMPPTSDDMNLVVVINLGADDLLAKPFELEVVLVKIQALLRRTCTFNKQKTVLRADAAVLNIEDGSLASGSGKLDLTKNELRIMKCLMEREGRVVSRNSIIRYLWGSKHFIDDNTFIVDVTRLRKKLGSIGLEGLTETKRGFGYLLFEAEICNEAAMRQKEVRSRSPSLFRIVKNVHPFVPR